MYFGWEPRLNTIDQWTFLSQVGLQSIQKQLIVKSFIHADITAPAARNPRQWLHAVVFRAEQTFPIDSDKGKLLILVQE